MINNQPELPEIKVIAFYKFIKLHDCENLKSQLHDCMKVNNIYGTILLAEEGINSTISGKPESLNILLNFLRADIRFADLKHKEAYFTKQVFQRQKVKIKKEIISLGCSVNPNEKVGKYLSSLEWNDLIRDPEVLIIDTRNDYEVELGSFERAINPQINKFKDLPEFTEKHIKQIKPKKVAMYCTGGIRCEKYSSYLLKQGFDEVYHLNGGILKYLEEIPQSESKWQGDCFVFDERRAVNHQTYQK